MIVSKYSLICLPFSSSILVHVCLCCLLSSYCSPLLLSSSFIQCLCLSIFVSLFLICLFVCILLFFHHYFYSFCFFMSSFAFSCSSLCLPLVSFCSMHISVSFCPPIPASAFFGSYWPASDPPSVLYVFSVLLLSEAGKPETYEVLLQGKLIRGDLNLNDPEQRLLFGSWEQQGICVAAICNQCQMDT